MILLNQPSVRDVILFPLMRPQAPERQRDLTGGHGVQFGYFTDNPRKESSTCISISFAGVTSRTRYIALASVGSVMLGVATMIVVNSVMAGFAEKMRDRLHGVLADVVVESYSLNGFYNSEEVMQRVMRRRRR